MYELACAGGSRWGVRVGERRGKCEYGSKATLRISWGGREFFGMTGACRADALLAVCAIRAEP